MAAVPAVGLKIVAGIILLGLAARFARKKVHSTDDSKPATLTDRGVRVPVVIGRTRGGLIHAFEGDRRKDQEPFSGGAGGKGVGSSGGQMNDVYFASGWHIAAVGPGWRLTEIYRNGAFILDKASQPSGFTPLTLPSGSTVPLLPTEEGQSHGTLKIYWGESNQPISTFLSDPTRLGYASNHAYLFHFVWEECRLGGAGTWPAFEYEYEIRPFNPGQLVGVNYDTLGPQLGSTAAAGEPWLMNSLGVPTGASCFDILTTDEGPPGSIKVGGNQTASFIAGNFLRIINAGSGINGNYEIQSSSFNALEQILPPGSFLAFRRTLNVPSTGNGWSNYGMALVDGFFTTGSGGGPPGVIVEPFGGAPPGTFPDTTAFTWIAAGGVVRAPPLASNVDPDGASPGDKFEFNDGYNYHTFYVRASQAGVSTNLVVAFTSEDATAAVTAGRKHGVAFSTRINFIEPGTFLPFGGAIATAVDLGTNGSSHHWYRIQIRFRVGDGGISVATDPCFIQYELAPGSPGASFIFVHGEGQLGSIPKWQYRNNAPVTGVTTILTTEQLFGIQDYSGQVCPLGINENGYQGANGAHIIYQLLFEEAPHGLGLAAACYDISSLQALGLLLGPGEEGIRSHITVPDSTTLDAVVQALLEELNTHLAWDTTTSKWTFIPVRRKAVPDAVVEREIILPDLPSRRRRFGEEHRTKLVFLYPNVDLRYRQDALTIAEDGRATQELREDGQKITLRTVRDPEAATQIGELRSLWEFSKPAAYSVALNRDASVLRPGDLLDFGELLGIDVGLRVMGLRPSSESAVVEVTLATDPYAEEAVSITSFRLGSTGPGTSDAVVVQDCIQRLWEPPAFLGREIQFVPLRVPLTLPTAKASLYASADDVNFRIEAQVGYLSGGTLAHDFLAETEYPESDTDQAINHYHTEEGPYIMACNDSFDRGITSLSEADWVSGRQMLIVKGEVLYVREFLPFGFNLWQARGVLRARLGTPLSDLLFGDEAYVFVGGPDLLQRTKILTAGRGLDLYWKLVPFGVSPGAVLSTTQEVTGEGTKPMALANFTTRDFSNGWATGYDLVLRWNYRLPQGHTERSGSGMQGYGEITGSDDLGSPWPGVFRVALFDDAGTTLVLGPLDLTVPEWVIAAGDLATAIAAAALPPDVDLEAAVIPIYSTGEIGERLQVLLPNVD